MSLPLHTTILTIPTSLERGVERPRLIEHLQAGFAGPLTLLSAPAGYGKTTLLVDALRQYLAYIVWVSLDPDESDIVRFVRYMLPALQPFAPTL